MINHLFTSSRLGFRNWQEQDILKMVEINSNGEVMKYFPAPATPEQTEDFTQRMQNQYLMRRHCYFAVDILQSSEFIGFIGLSFQDFESAYTPFVDVGWRLAPGYWNKGYATEGAKRCLEYGFNKLGLSEIYATAPLANKKSWHIMKKLGMYQVNTFLHPALKGNANLEQCVLYKAQAKVLQARY